MKTFNTLALSALLIFFGTSLHAQQTQPGDIPGDILLMLTPDGSAQRVASDLAMLDGVVTGMHVDHEVSAPMRIWLLRFDHAAVAQERMLRAVQAHPMVMMAQNDHPVTFRNTPNDPQYGQQWHHQNIDSEAAWAISTGGLTATGDTIVVCVIEASNLLHADLVANHWRNHQEIPNNGIDDDGNGYVDDYDGWNPGANNDNNLYGGGHGTNVAGMIGATGDNNLAVTGANWNVKIMVVTVGGLTQANVIASYTYPWVMRREYNTTAGGKGAFVVATNASWGIDNANPNSYPLWCAIYDSLGTDGILSCGATTNSNTNVDVAGDMPTACPSDFMVSVTATNNSDIRTFSGYGATTIDVGAPGANVVTTNGTNAGATGTTSTSGTSFASPLTAGVIGLLYSAPCPSLMALVNSDPMAGALYIRQMLFEGVDQVGNLPGNTVTGGRINAGTSMQLIMAACGACPAPYAPAVAAVGNDAVLFSWNAFADGPYTVQYRPEGTAEWTQVDGIDDLSYTATGLEPCTPYEFQVGIACEDGAVEYSVSALYQPAQGVVPTVGADAFPAVACAGESIILTSSSAFGNLWSNGATDQSIAATATGSYTVTVTGPCDELTSAPVEVLVLDPALPDAEDMVLIPGPGTATLTATGDSLVWYAAPSGGSPLGTGSPWETPFLNSSTSFWVGNVLTSDATPAFGGRTDRTTTGQYHTNASFWLLFTATEPFVIRSVKVYANGAGARPIGLVNTTSGATVVQGSFQIPDGESRVELGFTVPAAGTYALRVMSGDPQLWRDGVGSNPAYPYPLGTYGSITSSSATGNNALALYYFFYDWEVEPLSVACESERVEVLVEMPVGMGEEVSAGPSVYPNPADEQLFFELSPAHYSERAVVEVLDIAGRRVSVTGADGGRAVVATGHLAAGTYLYRVVQGGQEMAQGRFVVTHP